MEFLIFWLGTSVASFYMEIANGLRMFKDVADAGYKFDVKRMSELVKQVNPNAAKVTFLSMLIPVFNMMQQIKKAMQYNNVRETMLDKLSVIDALEELSEEEKAEYSKKPTGLNAIIISFKSDIRLSEATSTEIKDNKEEEKNEETISQELSISEQKQALENLKSELLGEQDTKKEKTSTLSKKRK